MVAARIDESGDRSLCITCNTRCFPDPNVYPDRCNRKRVSHACVVRYHDRGAWNCAGLERHRDSFYRRHRHTQRCPGDGC